MSEDAFTLPFFVGLEDEATEVLLESLVREFWIQNLDESHHVLADSILFPPRIAQEFVFLFVILEPIALPPERLLALEGEVESGFEGGFGLVDTVGRGRRELNQILRHRIVVRILIL